ncbi:MAG TPA: hypothetical protein VHC69_17890 [Polyangiaceae bacterium]|nr:hypothetical protein [Polyangiaceae bacterium]
MTRLPFGVSPRSLVAFALTSLGGLGACNSNNACEGVSCVPTVTVLPGQPLTQSGSWEVDIVADGKKMNCTLKVPSTAPAQCSDSSAYVAQESGKGITYVSVDGMYQTLSVTVKRDGATVAAETFSSLKYETSDFTGVGCISCPAATVTLNGEGPDASVGAKPDASTGAKPDASVGAVPDATTTVVTAPDAAADAR